MELTVQTVYELLLRSNLLSPEEAKCMFDRWRERSKSKANDTAEFARWMVSEKYLTDYQATLLIRGHADCFFLNQYKILDRLGKGRMAGVYRAVHSLGHLVAIKVLPPSKARDGHLFARFQRESKLAMKLNHRNVVRTYHMGEALGLHYLVMECLEGETLEEVISRRRQLTPSDAVLVVYQALLGLQHLHENALVHRDLKPANLMVVPEPSLSPPGAQGAKESIARSVVKILDMSLARTLQEDNLLDKSDDPHLTMEGTLLGTPDYMAPEQARDAHAADIRADIYSLGCVLYHLLAGQPPFPDTNIISQMLRHASESPPPLRDFNPSVPDGLQQIVNWMMAKDPNKRYPTPLRAAQALQVFLASGTPSPRTSESDVKLQSYLTWLERGADTISRAEQHEGAAAPQFPKNSRSKTPESIPFSALLSPTVLSVPETKERTDRTDRMEKPLQAIESASHEQTPIGEPRDRKTEAIRGGSPQQKTASTPSPEQPPAQTLPKGSSKLPASGTNNQGLNPLPERTHDHSKEGNSPETKKGKPSQQNQNVSSRPLSSAVGSSLSLSSPSTSAVSKPTSSGLVSPSQVDVELLPAQSHSSHPSFWQFLRLTPRDVMMYVLGAVTVLLAIGVGWLLAWLF